LVQIKNASFTLLQQIFRGEEKVFEMKIDLVYLDFAGNVSKIPPSEKEFLGAL
jgi:acyl-CoA thioester hydrolase